MSYAKRTLTGTFVKGPQLTHVALPSWQENFSRCMDCRHTCKIRAYPIFRILIFIRKMEVPDRPVYSQLGHFRQGKQMKGDRAGVLWSSGMLGSILGS